MDTREKDTRKFLLNELSKVAFYNSKFNSRDDKAPVAVIKARKIITEYEEKRVAERKVLEKEINKETSLIRSEIYLGDHKRAWQMLQKAQAKFMA